MAIVDQIDDDMPARAWDEMMAKLNVEYKVLTHLDWMGEPSAVVSSGKEAGERLALAFKERVSNELLLKIAAEKGEWTYLETEAKKASFEGKLSLFSWNTLLMPPIFSQLFGGACSWPERIDRMGALILDADTDVVSLYEVHDEEAAWALYDRLKDRYRYFVFNAGPSNITTDLDSIVMNSGLFVASRYPIENLSFTAYQNPGKQWGINKGYLSFSLLDQNQKIARVVATHLQPYKDERSVEIRREQLDEIYTHVKELYAKDQTRGEPTFVLGDLNIPYLGQGYDQTHLATPLFFDPYTSAIDRVTLDNQTDTDFYKGYYRGEPHKCIKEGKIVDYILLFRGHPSGESCQLQVRKIDAHDFDRPMDNLSDHHALFGEVLFGVDGA